MIKNSNDPGLGEKYNRHTKRLINKDRSLNVRKINFPKQVSHLYYYLTESSWLAFFSTLVLGYILVNVSFAFIYMLIGIEGLTGEINNNSLFRQFSIAFNFSYQTFTTVGYGALSPNGFLLNIVAAIESMIGFLAFAIATGLLYGRFSKPKAKIIFSRNALISKVNGKKALVFRLANANKDNLIDLEARVILAHEKKVSTGYKMSYYQLKLQIENILFFPTNWTIVHFIDEDSPLVDLSEYSYKQEHMEIIIQVKAFDETYGQVIYTRNSYLINSIVWNAKFKKAWTVEEEMIVFDLDKLSSYEKEENIL